MRTVIDETRYRHNEIGIVMETLDVREPARVYLYGELMLAFAPDFPEHAGRRTARRRERGLFMTHTMRWNI